MTKSEYNRAYYLKHRDKVRADTAAYYRAHREQMIAAAHRKYQRNRSKILAQKKIYHQQNREVRNAYNRAYSIRNRERLTAQAKAWRARNPGVTNARHRAYWKKVPEKFRGWQRKWVSRNRGVVRSYDAKRRARELAATIDATAAQWFYAIIHNQDVLTCAYCQQTVTPKNAHVDHIIPVSRGGEHGPNNFCIACPECNQSKNDSLLTEWRRCPERVLRLLEML